MPYTFMVGVDAALVVLAGLLAGFVIYFRNRLTALESRTYAIEDHVIEMKADQIIADFEEEL